MQFRLTRRALEDLGLSVEDYARLPANDFVDAHDVVRSFVEQRSQDPKGQEWTKLPVTSAPAYNLHHARYRGLTWHDEDADVVWLLGVGWHESGSRDDAYSVLKRRDEAGDLMPTEQDYLDLEMTLEASRSFVVLVSEQAPALIADARAKPGHEVRMSSSSRPDSSRNFARSMSGSARRRERSSSTLLGQRDGMASRRLRRTISVAFWSSCTWQPAGRPRVLLRGRTAV